MQVFYTARQTHKTCPVVYQPGRVRFCCDSMRQWWGRLLVFGVQGCQASTSREVCLYLSRPQANGADAVEVVPVDFCPWCAETIEPCVKNDGEHLVRTQCLWYVLLLI